MGTTQLSLMSDDVILKLLGERLSRHRLNQNVTQAVVAHEAGVSRDTLSRAENGRVIDTRSLVRILRTLGLLEGLDALIPGPRVSPVSLAKARGRVRERARQAKSPKSSEQDTREEAWTWHD